MSNPIAERVKQVMALTFNVPAESIADDASQDTVAAWDSLGHANLVLGLEEEFDRQLPDDVMPTLDSVPAIVAYFEQPA
ncbi:MAG: acyl carrier protein [Gemmatirosa sp.]|nr:acyl carrier protein [Gemmatirosa sp.]